MSRSTQSKPRGFWWIAGGTVAAALVVAALGWPQLQRYAERQASRYASMGERASGQQEVADYQLAHLLDPGEASYRTQLAKLYVAEGQSGRAVAVLGDSASERLQKARLLQQQGQFAGALAALQPVSGSAAAVARSQVYLEEGSGAQAITAAQAASGSAAGQVQLELSDLAAGRTAAAARVVAEKGSGNPQLLAAQYGGLALAQALYGRQLYRSAARVLTSGEVADSPAKYTLLANALLAQQPTTRANLTAAQAAAGKGLTIDPADLGLHQLLQTIDRRLGDRSGADEQQRLIDQLQSGAI